MATIVVHPEKDQLKAVKAFLKALKVPFEENKGEELPDHVIAGLKRSQRDIAEGRVYKFTTVEEMLGL